MVWLTNKKTGKPFNTDWIDKERQITASKEEADSKDAVPVEFKENTDIEYCNERMETYLHGYLGDDYIEKHDLGEKYENVDMNQWIEDFSQIDKTGGSCASAMLCYIGAKLGYSEVRDFRGGDSRNFYAEYIRQILKDFPDAKYSMTEGSDSRAALGLLSRMKKDKEYVLLTGGHTAVVRNNSGVGYPQYLELQRENFGWQTLDKETLVHRFMCLDDFRYTETSYLYDLDSISNEKYIPQFLQYISNPKG